MTTTNPVMIELLRGGVVESAHRGALAVIDADGALRLALGDVDRPVFPRSAVKALQALPLVASGAADRFGFGDAELALACASHGGEPEHVRVAAGMLAKVGLDASVLECGAHWPGCEPAARALAASGGVPGPLHNNCSGKHAGFVCVGCLLAGAAGADARGWLAGYVQPGHALMREVSDALGAATGTDLAAAPRGIDGCSIPTYGIALRALALGFARFGSGVGLAPDRARAAARLRQAVAAQPFMVGGSERVDTRLMQQLGARAFVKIGAEGVYCAALPELGLGVALKIDDGQARAAETAIASVVRALLGSALSDTDAPVLDALSALALRNWNGVAVGSLRPASALEAAFIA